ncbi:two-component response regulator-like PRR37 isoform X2 [Dioscorea cayenensis subsp. rotundata]|uniref:Two-component response regulator-like PRR37 isoform X2 n=1 Tax=Dioscorea cayennensis subsp. rotundata TaxID=55577 RepID=A0AB40CAS5_DIOCR|nr:two-component response regulator-like PRR37 isoform X2 [Dioscorea cayenensis subsp. rotundata]
MGNNNQMNSNGAGEEAPMEANQEMHDEPKDIRGIDLERQGILEEDETKINDSAKYVKDFPKGDIAQPQQPPLLGPIVHWERFLPVRSLNVLLVESDDSTRQLVSALLRNCSYEVTAAADAFQAWRILEDLTNRVDLILTEVNIPGLSGIGLLCKIMSHRMCKNIPVIMMSSNDSVGTVFKCLSKGAVDFLVKPIRKNELKNLWQHVWRRCHSSSGSGSESGIQHQKSIKSKSPVDSDDNTDSNDEDDNGSFGQNLRDGSDNSSWTKHAVEDDSPQQMSPSDPLADPYDSTCAQVIHSKQGMPKSTNQGCQEQREAADKNSSGKDLEKGAPQNPDGERIPYSTEKASSVTGASMERLPECNPKVEMNENVMFENVPGRESSNASCGPVTPVAGLIGGIADNCESRLANRLPDTPDGFSKISKCKDKANEHSKELPTLELSLKRLRSSGDVDDHNILRHSDLSAFSRYNSPNSQTPRGRGASSSNPHDTSEEIKSESTYSMLNTVALKQGSNGSSNNNDMGSTTKDAFTKLPAHKEKIASTAAAKTIYPSTLHHTPHRPSSNQPPIQEKVDDVAAQAMAGQVRGVQHEIQVQHHHHHYHHHHHHLHSRQEQQPVPPSDRDDISLNNMVTTAPQCGSSNMFPGSMEINAMNYSLNGSASGSNHMSNGHNGNSKAVNAGVKNMDCDAGVAANGEAGGTSLVDQNRFSQREVALNKFRQKRKERNFGKKVRYQSRKRLAEQRPRVRGQFVRRTTHEHTSREGSS